MGSWALPPSLLAIRMLEAGTGFSTPRNVTWVSESTSPQLGRSPMTAGGKTTLEITSAQLSMLIEGLNWQKPERAWRPAVAG